MLRWIALFVMGLSLPASAATIETKYFSLMLPESFNHIEGNKNRDAARAMIFASANKKQFIMIEYANKERENSSPSGLDRIIENENDKVYEVGAKNGFWGVKLEKQECLEACEAYYRENRVNLNYVASNMDSETDMPSTGIYQYFYKNKNTVLSLNYFDGVNDTEKSHEIMESFIEQIRHSASAR